MIAAVSSHSDTFKASVSSVAEALEFAREYGTTVDRLNVYASDDEMSEDGPIASYSRIRGKWTRDIAA
jgi:hypothetical protein